jgi:predicted metal-dependent HD superfamily phosphohydrolase
MSADDLRLEWLALWRRLEAKGDPWPTYENLLERYAGPGRAYHTIVHVEHCLRELADVGEPTANLDALQFALWFHDAVYDTRAKDNEERSAALAREVARSASLSDGFGDRVTALILATKHTDPPITADEQLLVDVDLTILGQQAAKFDEYESQIRAEYSWVPAGAYVEARCRILSSFLARPRIYSTEFFGRKYEGIARENLSRSMRTLAAMS